MRLRPLYVLLVAVLLLFISAIYMPAAAKTLEITQSPPEPIYEVDPGSRPGFILTPGYWRWNGTRHVWRPSRWIAEREGYNWVGERWEQRGDKWALADGHWETDPNYVDVVEEEIVTPPQQSAAAPIKKKQIKRVRKIDYSDTNKWPRHIRR